MEVRFYGEQELVRIWGSWGMCGVVQRGAGMGCSLWQAPHGGYLQGDGSSEEPEAQILVMFCFNYFICVHFICRYIYRYI